jgi:hypothetical protein
MAKRRNKMKDGEMKSAGNEENRQTHRGEEKRNEEISKASK